MYTCLNPTMASFGMIFRHLLLSGIVALTPSVPCRLMFTSPLHRGSFLYGHFHSKRKTSKGGTIGKLITDIVERMDPVILQTTERLSSNNRQLEACWRTELCRAVLECLPPGRAIAPDIDRVGALCLVTA